MTREEFIHEQFRIRGTDKCAHKYAPVYARIPENIETVLEIGITANSLLAWTDLFPYATVYGMDKDRKSCEHSHVRMIEADITDFNPNELPPFDLIVDDGSHNFYEMLAGWYRLNHLLRGTYIIEGVTKETEEILFKVLSCKRPEVVVTCETDNDSRVIRIHAR